MPECLFYILCRLNTLIPEPFLMLKLQRFSEETIGRCIFLNHICDISFDCLVKKDIIRNFMVYDKLTGEIAIRLETERNKGTAK